MGHLVRLLGVDGRDSDVDSGLKKLTASNERRHLPMHSFYTRTGLGGDCSCRGTGFWTLVGLLTAVREDPAPAMLVEGHGMETTGIRDCEETLWTSP